MLDVLINILIITAIAVAGRAYYRSLDDQAKKKHDFRDDGQLHLIYPQ